MDEDAKLFPGSIIQLRKIVYRKYIGRIRRRVCLPSDGG